MFGRKKPAPEAPQPQKRKGAALMSQMGMADIEAELYGDVDNDEDLEAELLALEGKKPSPKRKPKGPVSASEFDRMIADSMKDLDDEEISDTEDPDLMDELKELEDDDDGPSPGQPPPPRIPQGGGGSMVNLLEDRLQNYTEASASAKAAGDSSKQKRLDRMTKTIQDLLKKARQGRPVDEDDIPPPVAVTTTKRPQPPPPTEKFIQTFEPAIPSQEPKPKRHVPEPAPRRIVPLPNFTPTFEPTIPIHESGPKRPAPEPAPRRTAPPPPQPQPGPSSGSSNTASAQMSSEDKQKHDMLSERRNQYKKAALAAKKKGDIAMATKYAKTAKQFDRVLEAVVAGNPIDLSQMPPPPPGFDGMQDQVLKSLVTPMEPQIQRTRPQGAGEEQATAAPPPPSEEEEKDLFKAPEPPKTTMEALQQRLEKYKNAEQQAKEQGETSKARRMGRITKQYQDAIKCVKAGRPVDFEELPTPPGYAPIPTGPQAALAQAPAPALTPNTSSLQAPAGRGQSQRAPSPGGQRAAPVSAPRQPSPAAHQQQHSPQKQTPSSQSQKVLKRSPSSRADQQASFLRERMSEYKTAAFNAKKKGDIELAKKYLRLAKGFEPMIEASESGLPVDLTQVPPSLSTEDNNPSFVIVSKEDCELSGDREEVFQKLETDLVTQIRTCQTNSSHFSKLGDVISANKFQKMEQGLQKDLQALKNGLRHNDPVPKFHYENRTFSLVQCNTDLGDNDIELNMVRGIQYNPPSGYSEKDLDTYIKFEFPFPTDDNQVGQSETVKGSFNPEYQETVKLTMNRKSRALVRVVERKTIKFEVWYKRGFLKSDKLLGTVNVKLLPLETQCTLHDSYDLTDGRKSVGGKLEVKVRIRDPFKSKQVEEVKEKWLVIDQFIKTLSSTKVNDKAQKSTNGTTCVEVLKFEKQQLDKQISSLRESLNATQLSALTNKSKLIQDKMDQQMAALKSGGIEAIKEYLNVIEKDIVMYGEEGKNYTQRGDMQKAQLMLTKKKLAEKEVAAFKKKFAGV